MKYLIIVAVIVLVVFVVFDYFFPHYRLNPLNPNMKPYIASGVEPFSTELLANYPDISTLPSTDTTEVININEQYGFMSNSWYVAEHDVTVLAYGTGDNDTGLLLLDANGATVEEAVLPKPEVRGNGRYAQAADFIVTRDGWYQVQATGLSERSDYSDITTTITSTADLENLYAESVHVASFDHLGDWNTETDQYDRIYMWLFFHQGTWKRAVVPDTLRASSEFFSKNIRNMPLDSSTEEALDVMTGYQLDYFTKKKYIRARGPMIGSTTGLGVQAQWKGDAHFSIESPTIPLTFTITDQRLYADRQGKDLPELLGKAGADFVILTTLDYSYQETHYLIRPVQ